MQSLLRLAASWPTAIACAIITPVTLDDGRGAFERGAWSQAYTCLSACDTQAPLDPEDLDCLAIAAYLVGRDAASVQARTRAHNGFLERGDARSAARSAFWLAFTMLDRPNYRAQAAGWLARAQRLIDDLNEPCVEQGWLLCASARQRAAAGDLLSAHAAFTAASEIAARFGSRDLLAMARHGQGRALVAMNRPAEGLALLDEVMVAVTGGEVAPLVAGAVYCSVITACHDLFDLHRAQEWTAALQRWCASQPDLVPFRGYCLIRRSELMQLHGSWESAFGEVRRACEQLADSPPEAGAAYYQLAELHRLRGNVAEAEETYRLASQAGRKPQPGLALLRLAQGQIDAADAAIRLALQESGDRRSRVFLLAAAAEIMLARENSAAARLACSELEELATGLGSPYVHAVTREAQGAVALAENEPLSALESLRAASSAWQELDAPYERARVRVRIGLAYRQLGDQEGAQLEFDAAQEIFERLGAAPDAARVAALSAHAAPPASSNLTGREVEVLRLIATGVTNREIGTRLSISEKTVARHVSNIFTKLGLSSRAAATAYAYDHKLL